MRQKGFIYFVSLIFLALFSISAIFVIWIFFKTSFEPSYSLKRVTQHITDICQKEYFINVEAEQKNQFIWITHSCNFVIVEKDNKLTAESEKIIKTILKVFGRIIQSMDEIPEFYAIQLISEKGKRVEFRLIGTVKDILYFHSGMLSRNEYVKNRIRQFYPETDISSMNLHMFIKELIKQRIEDFRFLEKYFLFRFLKIDYQPKSKNLKIIFDIRPKQKAKRHLILNQIKKITVNIIEKYSSKDFNTITYIDKYENFQEKITIVK